MNWFQKWRKNKQNREQARGFDYAAGHLLRGKSVKELETRVESAIVFGDYGPFDRGCQDALVRWREQGRKA